MQFVSMYVCMYVWYYVNLILEQQKMYVCIYVCMLYVNLRALFKVIFVLSTTYDLT